MHTFYRLRRRERGGVKITKCYPLFVKFSAIRETGIFSKTGINLDPDVFQFKLVSDKNIYF